MEYFDILDSFGRPTGGMASRSEVHRLGFWHGSSHIWLVDPTKGILMQKRAKGKDTFPGRWDIACAGHLDAGEEPATAAVRELKEELGLVAALSELQFLFRVKNPVRRPDWIDREFNYVFLWQSSFALENIRLQTEEVEAVRFFSRRELTGRLKSHPEEFSPHPKEYPRILKMIAGRTI